MSAKEPVCSINRMLDEAEKDERVFSCSYHVGYIRHDDDKLGAAVTVIPNTYKDKEYCKQVAEKVANYAWEHRHEFKFSGNYDEADMAVKKAIEFSLSSSDNQSAVITDSGDNCGAGGYGQNTYMLRELLNHDLHNKKVLVAGINDRNAYTYLKGKQVGNEVDFSLGINEDEGSAPVHIQGILIAEGDAVFGLTHEHNVGKAYTLHIKDSTIDVIVLDHNVQYGTMRQFDQAGVHFHDYDIIVVKMGYLDTYLIPETAYHIMALTDGPTNQRSETIPFKKIARPMWPIDDIEELEYIK